MYKAALSVAALALVAAPAFAGVAAPGVGLSLDRHTSSTATVKVYNPGRRRGTYSLELMDALGNTTPAETRPAVVRLSPGKSRKVRILNVTPTTTQLCASVTATSSLRLQSCSRLQR